MRKYLKDNEVQELITAAKDKRDRLIITILYEAGLRVTELCNLNIRDIDFDSEEIIINSAKYHKEGRRVALINPYTVQKLHNYIDHRTDGPLFLSKCQQHKAATPREEKDYFRLRRKTILYMVKKYAKTAGISQDKAHPHALRHAHAVHALKAGINLAVLKENLGHSDLSTTGIYLTLDTADRIAEYKKLWNTKTATKLPSHTQSTQEEPQQPCETTYSYTINNGE